jgi:tetratricopeptide (TPR) repeat protein
MGNGSVVGEPIPARMQKLQTERWLSIAELTSVTSDSPDYNEKDRAGIFYAETWALVHMLYLSPDYRPNFDRLVAAFNAGQDTANAFQQAYGKRPEEVYADLGTYMRHQPLSSGVLEARLEKAGVTPKAQTATAFETALALADLLATTRHYDDAKRAFLDIEKQFPGRPETSRSLGYLEWKAGNERGARDYFEKAFTAGDADAEMCFHLAMMQRRQNVDSDTVKAVLLRALKSKPDYIEARIQLAYLELGDQNYRDALAAFNAVAHPAPDQASELAGGKALVYYSLGELDTARRNAEEARKLALTAPDTERAETILRDLDRRAEGERLAKERAAALRAAPPVAAQPAVTTTDPAPRDDAPLQQFPPLPPATERAEGTAIAFDCARDGAKLRMRSGERTLVFGFDDPEKVMLRHNGRIVHEFTCGPQKPYRVAVEFEKARPEAGIVGWIRLLEF